MLICLVIKWKEKNMLCYSVNKNCKNPDSYGEICVRCNKCGRFDVFCLICKKLLKPKMKVYYVELHDKFTNTLCPKDFKLVKKYVEKGSLEFYRKYFGYDKYLIPMKKKELLKSIKNKNGLQKKGKT